MKIRLLIGVATFSLSMSCLAAAPSVIGGTSAQEDASSATKIVSHNVADGAVMGSLSELRLVISGTNWKLAEGASCHLKYTSGTLSSDVKPSASRVAVTTDGNTVLVSDYRTLATGAPRAFKDDIEYEISYPEGTLVDKDDQNIKSPEFSIHVLGKLNAAGPGTGIIVPPVAEVEYVDGSMTVNSLMQTKLSAFKGEPFNLTLTTDKYWKIKSLTLNNEDVTDKVVEGVYTFTPEADFSVASEVEYDGEVTVEQTSGIANILGSDISVISQGNEIVISGIEPGSEVAVYTASGLVMINTVAEANSLSISLPNGQTYIVRIGPKAVKLTH
ncbi:MAG: hypothetical protein NC201_04775 [Prevotella sp.]|nr:hypothetical protein [Bacteroides sp.]MCM1366544.1 hypothetical protein [Prevotella sp.]MCM1436854.1 hypothetical protein [Prevotella sp.]